MEGEIQWGGGRESKRDLVRGEDYALVIECEREIGRERWCIK